MVLTASTIRILHVYVVAARCQHSSKHQPGLK